MFSDPTRPCAWLRGTAVFALLWTIARAAIQSITIDEADTFLAYAGPPFPTHWSGSANNHLLNSMLMRLSTSVFGMWHLSVRAPALLGASIYIWAAYALARAIARETALAWPLLVCLVYNPFIMDYLVAARGYSLALGFWMAALAIGVREGGSVRANCAASSICAALSFAANFSFALLDIFTMLFVLWRACRRVKNGYAGILAACVLPGLTVAAFLAGSVLWTWPKGQFVYGAGSLHDTFKSVLACSLYEVNPYLVNPPLRELLETCSGCIFLFLGIVCAWKWWRRRSYRQVNGTGQYLSGLWGVLVLTLAAHWSMFRFLHILLPMERTAIYVPPLLFLIAGAAVAAPKPSKPVTAAFLAGAVYFLCCLRLTYFREWKWDAETKQAYFVLAWYNHRFGVRDIFPNWRYSAALNFYRIRSGRETIPRLEYKLPPYPGDRTVYVMFLPDDQRFIEEHGLKIVYHGRLSDVVVAIRPEVETAWCGPVPAR
jgi:hypothetical protein